MTKKKNQTESLTGFSSFHLEADRSPRGMQIFITGIVGIGDYSDEELELKSHGGRIKISGKRLKLCLLENSTVEIKGKVEGVVFSYGKS